MLFIKKGLTAPVAYICVALGNVCEELDIVPTITSITPTQLEVRVSGFQVEDVDELVEGLKARLPLYPIRFEKGFVKVSYAH